jgi:hypothetical protein
MRLRRAVAIVLGAASLALPAGALATGYSTSGTPEQIAWVRRAATNFVAAELARNGEAACAILDAPLRVTRRHRTCAQRMDARIAATLRVPGARARLRAQLREIQSAPVVVQGRVATISLPSPLLTGPNRFLWTENCWMLED